MAPRKVILGLEANHLKVGSGGGGGEGVKVAGGTKAGGRHDDDCYEETTTERHPQDGDGTNNYYWLMHCGLRQWFGFSLLDLFVSFATYSKRLRTSDIRRGLFALAPSASKAFFSEKLLNRGNQDHGLPGALLINRTQKQTQTQ